MAITLVQTPKTDDNEASPTTTFPLAYTSNVTAGSLLIATITMIGGANTPTVADNVNGSWTQDVASSANPDNGDKCYIFSKANAGAGATTVTVTQASGLYIAMTLWELGGAATSSALDATGSDATLHDAPTATVITTAANSCIIAGGSIATTSNTITPGTNFTEQAEVVLPTAGRVQYDEYWLDVGATGSKAVTYTPSLGFSAACTIASAAYKVAGGAGPSSFSKPMWPMSYF